MKEELHKDIDDILDRIHDPMFFYKQKNHLKSIFNEAGCDDAREYIKTKLIEGKRYSVLKLIDKLELKYDSSLFTNFLKYEENYNMNIYMILFHLHAKELISTEGMDNIRNIFIDYHENSKDHILEEISSLEDKILLRKIDLDRKKIKNEKKNSVVDEEVDLYMKNLEPLTRKDVKGLNFIDMNPKKVFVYDITDLFTINKNLIYNDRDIEICENFEKIIYKIYNERFPSYADSTIITLNCHKRLKEFNYQISKETRYLENDILEFKDIFRKLKVDEKRNREFLLIDEILGRKFSKLNNEMFKYFQKLHYHIRVYFLTRKELAYTSTEIALYNFSSINNDFVVSSKYVTVDKIINGIKLSENVNYITYFENGMANSNNCLVNNDLLKSLDRILQAKKS